MRIMQMDIEPYHKLRMRLMELLEEYERLQNQLVGQSLSSTERENLVQLGKFDTLSKVRRDLEELVK